MSGLNFNNVKNFIAVEGRGSLSSSFLSSGLAQGKGTENLPSHIRPPASCARGEMHPAFLGVMAGRIFLWVQGDREVALAVPVLRYKKPRCGG